MKIYFCDICNESIPLKDLNEGGVLAIKGKMICRNCNPFPQSTGKSSFASWMAIGGAAVAIAALGLSIWLIVDRQAPAPTDFAGSEATQEALAILGERIDALETELEDLEAPTEAGVPVAALAELEARQKSGARRIAETDEKLEAVRQLLDSQEDVRRRVDTMTVELRDLATQVSELRSRQASTDLAVEALQGRLEGMALAPAPVEPASDAGVPEEPEEAVEPERDVSSFDERTRALIEQLESDNPSVRFNAVDELIRMNEPKLVPWLVDKLRDEDMFVRYLVAEGLGQLGRKDAVPALIESLADEESIVRDSAHRSLEALLGADVAYDPNGTPEERSVGMDRWKKAWEESRSR